MKYWLRNGTGFVKVISRAVSLCSVTGNWECRRRSDVLRRWRSCDEDFAAFCSGYFWRLLSADEKRAEMRSLDAVCLGVAATSRSVRLSAAVRKCTPVSRLDIYRALFSSCLTDKHRPHGLPALRSTPRTGEFNFRLREVDGRLQ